MRKAPSLQADPIAAIATPPGRGAIAIIRISGDAIAQRLFPLLRPQPKEPRKLTLCHLLDPVVDQGLVAWFPAPNSFTGEEMIEIHCHATPPIQNAILSQLQKIGIRPAQPGEFARRAFLNGKMDLLQAESLAALIAAETLRAARIAQSQMNGTLSRYLLSIREKALEILVHLEAHIDFSEEDIDPQALPRLALALQPLLDQGTQLLAGASLGQRLNEGARVAVIGRPNVGKSSLFNLLHGNERAIVSDTPGTTRDFLEAPLEVNGVPLLLIDTAGLRSGGDPIEQEGMRRSEARMLEADIILLMAEAPVGWLAEDEAILTRLPSERTILVWNKIDLLSVPFVMPSHLPSVALSVKEGEGVEDLLRLLGERLGSAPGEDEGLILMAARQRQGIQTTCEAFSQALSQLALGRYPELAAESLRTALSAIGELVGEVTHDDLLDGIFSRFCIGK